jgi:hypothetical protein
VTPVADGLDHAGGLMPEQEREVVVDAALPVVQVGVADPAGLHLHQRLTGAGVGDMDLLDGDRLTLGSGDDSSDDVRHGDLLSERISALTLGAGPASRSVGAGR